MKKIIWLVFVLILSINAQAQLGKSFWFVAPDVIAAHGDEPLVIRITTYDDDANVTISMPANNGFTPKNVHVNSNSQESVEVKKSDVENTPVDRVNNKGLLIESDADVAVYYEVANAANPDKFSLKGDEALGTHFFVPSQNLYPNHSTYGGDANEKVDIVATEDGTEVTIVPSQNVTGHVKGVPYTIILNRGETYCLECRSLGATVSLGGTEITSNNDIAVTVSDDSILERTGVWPHDLIGDQIVPVSVLGKEYVAIRANDDAEGVQKVFVLATEDNTFVYLNNNTSLGRQLDKGEMASFDIIGSAIYITSDKPVYAYQLSGLMNHVNGNWRYKGNEIGSALLPSIECTGSTRVAITKLFDSDFWVQLLVKEDDRSSFVMEDTNGNSVNYLSGIVWNEVPGTRSNGDAWFSATINLRNSGLSTSSAYFIENTKGLFHLAVLDENSGSLSYGYFSGYGSMTVVGPTQACEGNSVVLSTSEDMRSYSWYSEFDSNVLSTNETLSVSQSGKYWVTGIVDIGGCEITDSIDVDFHLPEVDLGNDTTVCPGETVSYSLPTGYSVYNWSNGATSHQNSILVTDGYSSTLSVDVTDDLGCSNSQDVLISAYSVPSLSLNSTTVCEGERIIATSGFDKYVWEFQSVVLNTDQTQNFITPTQSGLYSLTVETANGCEIQQDFNIVVNSLPQFTIGDVKACDQQTANINGPNGAGYSYEWNTGETTSSISLSSPASFSLKVTDANGCEHTENGTFDWYEPNLIDLGDDKEECAGITLDFEDNHTYSNFEWIYRKDASSPEVVLPTPTPEYRYEITNSKSGDSGMYGVRALDPNGCPVSDNVNVTFYDTNPPVLQIDENLCAGTSIEIIASEGYDSYQWIKDGNPISTAPNQNVIQINDGGLYSVIATYQACVKTSEIDVTEHNAPTVDITDDFSFCRGTVANISVNSFTGDNGAAFDYLTWENENKKVRDWTTAVYEVENAGTFSVTAYDEYGCSSTDAVTVSEFTKSVLELGGVRESCDGTNVILSNPLVGATNYEWYKIEANNDVVGPKNADWAVSQSGSYRIDLLDVNGCEEKDTVVISMLPTPLLDLGNDIEICQGEEVTITANGTFDTYEWNSDPLQNTASITVNTAGIYDLEVTNSYGCSASDDVELTVHSAIQFDIPDRSVCAGEEVVLSVPSGITNYKWSTRETTSSITVGRGKYWLDVQNANGCTSSDTAVVNWYPVPNVTLGPDTAICPLEQLTLDAGAGYASYQWQNGSADQTITAEILDIVNLVTVSNINGCYGFDTRTVIYESPGDVELFSDTSICASSILELDAGDGYLSYLWNDGDTQQQKEITEPGEYTVEVSDGCFIITDTAEVVHLSEPLILNIDSTNYGQVIIAAEGGAEPYKYSLIGSLVNLPPQEKNIFNNLENDDYELTVEDDNGCIAEASFSLNSIMGIEVPPFFTPNKDGINDNWKIEGLDRFPNSIIIIYDRFGKILAKYNSSENDEGWDGTYLGKPVPTDDYWYVVELRNVKKTLKGHVTLKR